MFETLLITTSSDGLQPLGSAPQRSFELVSNTIRDRLGAEHANLFAEPVAAEHGEMIDWYAPIAGSAVPMSDLPEPDQKELQNRLGTLVAEIQAEAEMLGQSPNLDDQRLSEALINAVEVPDKSMIYAVRAEEGGLHPVLVHWSWVKDARDSVRGVLTAMVPRSSPGVTSSGGQTDEHPQRSAFWWWLLLLGWLLLAAILAYILYLLIAPCGLNNRGMIFCPKPAPAINAIPSEARVIEDEIAILQHELALKDRACQPTIPVLPAKPALGTNAPSGNQPEAMPDKVDKGALSPEDVGRKIVERGAERGALNFALSWSSTDDVDLSVTCPNGQTISYKNRVDCNGTYDLDANVKRGEAVSDPVENVVFQEVVPGVYKVRAHLKGNRTDGEKAVTLHVLRKDGRSQTYSGIVSDKAPEWSVNISISR